MNKSQLTGQLTFKSLKPLDLSVCDKTAIRAYFENSYDLNESLFMALKDESVFYLCPDRLRLPLIFYFAHTAVVYINKLILAGAIQSRVNLEFETLFETGVDEMSWDDTENYRMGGSFKWPPLEEVMVYRRKVKDVILKFIEDTPLTLPVNMESVWWGLLMGMEHERIHIETSSVLIRQLPVEMLQKPEGWVYGPTVADKEVSENPLVLVKGKTVTIGKPVDFPSYGWDNEYGEFEIEVPEFKASKYMVTNGDFLKFVQAGGYASSNFWSAEGWRWRQYRQANHPPFWVCHKGCKGGCGGIIANHSHCHLPADELDSGTNNNKGEEYRMRLMFDEIPLPLDWPVEVNYHEARAYCSWKGGDFRLPTEAEHHVMRGNQIPASQGTSSDIIFQDQIEANLNLHYGSSTPVNLYPSNELGLHDVWGNVWGWVEDHYNGLPGFHTHWLYDDFSSPCFDGKHNMILGGSWASTGDEASRFARFAFRRHFLQHCGFRMVQSIKGNNSSTTVPARVITTPVFVLGQGENANVNTVGEQYKVRQMETTNLHYSCDGIDSLKGILELEFGFRDSFSAVAASHCAQLTHHLHVDTASIIHLGSGVGRGSLELSKTFDEVLAVEPVGRFADTSMKLQEGKPIDEVSTASGWRNLFDELVSQPAVRAERVLFKQLTWLPNEVSSHNVVLLTHLERVQNPKAWLVRVWEITKSNGIAVVASSDGRWNQDSLMDSIGKRMECVMSKSAMFEGSQGRQPATLTAWRRRV